MKISTSNSVSIGPLICGSGYSAKTSAEIKLDARRVVVPSQLWENYQEIAAKAKAADRAKKAALAALQLPAADASSMGHWLIVNGNSQPIGKLTVSEIAEATIIRKAHFRARVS